MASVSPDAKARRKEYDKKRMVAKRAAEKLNPPEMTPARLAAIERHREMNRLRYHRNQAAKPEKVPKPTKAPKPKPIVLKRAAPAYHKWDSETEAVIPPGVKRTIAETPKPRFHVEAPAEGFVADWKRLRA